MTEQELGSIIQQLFEDAERDLNNKRVQAAKEQKFLREHNFNIEQQAFTYKNDAYSDADYILFNLKRQIFELFEEIYTEREEESK